MIRILLTIFLITLLSGVSLCQTSISGVVNSYTIVYSVGANSVEVDDVSMFAAGDTVLLIQMKGASITTTQDQNFGDITSFGNAGNYEFLIVESVDGFNFEVIFTCNISRNYNPNGLVQLVRVPSYENAVVTGMLEADKWDIWQETGGVLAIIVRNTLTLNSGISASSCGFWGGNPEFDNNMTSACASDHPDYQLYYYHESLDDYAGVKGEGIAKENFSYFRGRGKYANGGGGGNTLNAAGGGGSNFGVGGKGGLETDDCFPPLDVGGIGGVALPYSNIENRIFFGGGGGCGTQEIFNSDATAGGFGGGIVIIIAGTIVGNGNTIEATGESIIDITADESAGGGGGGGNILLNVGTFVDSLYLDVSGGKGGDATPGSFGTCRGTGAGGGGGMVWHSGSAALPGEVIPLVSGGNAGSHTDGSCTNYIGEDGSNGGTLNNLSIPLNCIAMCSPTNNLIATDHKICSGSIPDPLNGTMPIGGSSGGSYTYLWQSSTDGVSWVDCSGTNNQQNYTPIAAISQTTYYHRIVDPGACQSISNIITIEAIEKPDVEAGASIDACVGEDILLDGSIGNTPMCSEKIVHVDIHLETQIYANEIFYWIEDESGNIVFGPLGPNEFANGQVYDTFDSLAAGIYTLYAYDSYGDGWHGGFINVVPESGTSVLNFFADPCGNNGPCGNAITFSVEPVQYPCPLSYSWGGPNSFSSSSLNPAITNIDIINAGTYYLTVDPGTGCVGVDSVDVTVSASLDPSWTSPGTLCEDAGPVDLNTYLTGDSGGTWSSSFAGIITGSSLQTAGLSGLIDIIYTLGSGACTQVSTQMIDITPSPNVTITGNDLICSGQSTTLTANGASFYEWSTLETTTTISHVPVSTTTYYVTGTDSDGCSDSSFISVVVLTPPAAAISGDLLICEGESTTLTASGGISYNWSSGQITDSITVTPASDEAYTVTVSNGQCEDTEVVTVIVSTSPIAAISTDDTICSGDAITLTASGGDSYVWVGTQTNVSITDVPTSTTLYTVTATLANGCTDEGQFTVVVNSLPSINIAGPASICYGSNTTLNAGTWSSVIWDTGESDSAIVVSPVTATTYFVSVTDSNGCENFDDHTINVNSLVTDITGDNTICDGDSLLMLTASGGTSYLWSDGQTGSTVFVSPDSSMHYYVTVIDNGCNETDSIYITVIPLPQAIISGVGPVCEGDSITLIASGGSNYSWNTGETSATITVAPLYDTLYSVTVEENGCFDSEVATITVSPLPFAQIIGEDTICTGESVQLNASGGTSYIWNTGDTDSIITYSPNAPTTYIVTVTKNGCFAVDSFEVNITNSINAVIEGDNFVCYGDSVTLVATDGAIYNWSNGINSDTNNVAPLLTTTYEVTVTSLNGFCSGVATQTVTVLPLPVINFVADSAICNGDSTDITAQGGISYIWNTGSTDATINVSPSVTTTYTVTVSDGICHIANSYSLVVTSIPVANISGNNLVCAGETATLIASGGNQYEWSTGDTGYEVYIEPLTTGIITVTVTQGICTDTANHLLTVMPLPDIQITGDSAMCYGDTITLTANGGLYYTWDFIYFTEQIDVSPTGTTTYYLTGADDYCYQWDSIIVTVNPVPVPQITGDTNICFGEAVELTASGGSSFLWSEGQTSAQISLTPTSDIDYYVTVTDNNCSSVANWNVDVLSLPIASIFGNDSLCEGSTGQISVNISGNGPWNLIYTDGTNQYTESGITESPHFINVSPSLYEIYTLISVEDNNNCIADDISGIATITVFENPVINAGQDVEVCGDTYQLQATHDIGAGYWTVPSGVNISQSSASDAVIVVDGFTAYTLIWNVSNAICNSSDDVIIDFYEQPDSAYAGEDQQLDFSYSTILSAHEPASGIGTWSVESGTADIINVNDANTEVDHLSSGDNILRWTVSNSICPQTYDELTISVAELSIPDGFSPNGDDVNELFVINGSETRQSNVKIFNRWGNQVFIKDSYQNDWDGTDKNGKPLPEDTYFYIIQIDDEEYNGYLIIKR